VTGPSQPTPAPGWYPDPDGAAGQVRWWNGVTWSDVTTPAGPGVAVQSSPLLAPPMHPTGTPDAPEIIESGSPGGSGKTGWIIAISVLVLVIVVGAGLVVGNSGDEGTPAASSSTTSSSPAPDPIPAPGPTTFPPGTVRIIDEAAGISYPYLGDGWLEFNLFPQVEVATIAGQYFTTQEVTPDNTVFIAQCTSGPLSEGYGWAGPSTLASTLATVADSVRGNYYPQPNERKVLREEERTVDGRAAYLYEFQLSWDAPGYDATGERAALLLIDVGRETPALLYISIPNTHAELYGVIDRVLDAVEVL
jgi:Protein of unknown function (DUF2510)